MYTTASIPVTGCFGHARPRTYQRIQAALMARLHTGYEKMVSNRKQELFAGLEGDILEIGPGTGANLAYFPLGVRWKGLEANPYMLKYLHETASRLGLEVEAVSGTAQHLPVQDGSVDAVVGTLVMCSVDEPSKALGEILRVLKPGGRYLFIEHVAAPRGTRLRRLQAWARPFSRLISDGCRPDRETWAVIQKAGFSEVQVEHFNVGSGLSKPHIMGFGVK